LVPGFVVIHYTAMQTAHAAITRLCDPGAEVSAHYVICKTGRVTQLVGEGLRAWHAGAGEWHGLTDMNSRSIGIELDNDGQGPFTQALMGSLEGLLARILPAWDIQPQNVIGHSDMAPGRKDDPGRHFDWARLATNGLAADSGNHPEPFEPDPALFRKMAQRQGYSAQTDDATLLRAVRLRHRPHATGPLAPADFAVLGNSAVRA
jgi:N-acetylmuramoyl-L-alanine amidase